MRIQPLKSYLSGMLTLIFLGSGTIANAVLITHTGTHAGASTTTQIDFFSQGTNQFDSDESSVDGIPKFNPALGTLNRVIVSSTLEYEFEFEFFATSTDEFDPFVEFSADLAQANIGIQTSPTSGVFVLIASESTSLSGDGGDSIGPIMTSETGSTDVLLNPSVTAAMFTGAGDVDVLEAVTFVPSVGMFSANADTDAFTELELTLAAGTVTVTYDYTPVPEPSSLVFAVALASVCFVRRRPERQPAGT